MGADWSVGANVSCSLMFQFPWEDEPRTVPVMLPFLPQKGDTLSFDGETAKLLGAGSGKLSLHVFLRVYSLPPGTITIECEVV